MNYLVATDRYFGDAPGGQFGIAWELARAASSAGHRAALLCGSFDGDPPAGRSEVDGVEIVRYRIPDRAGWKLSRFAEHAGAAASAFRDHLTGTCWDTVHAHSLVTGSLLGTRLPGRRTVYTAHSPATLEQSVNWSGPGPGNRLRRALGLPMVRRTEARALQGAAVVHVLSRFTEQALAEIHGDWVMGRVSRIPWWSASRRPMLSPEEARRRVGWPTGIPVVFTLRRLVPRMGLDTFVDALARLAPDRPFLAVIGGEGPERTALESRSADLVSRGKVRFAGRLSDEERDLAYRAADLFVVPTRALECFGMIVVEALAQGCPVISSRAGALPEIMDSALPGWTFEPGNVEGLAALLARVIGGDLVSPPRERLAEWANANYGQAKIWPAYEELITG